MFTPEHFIQIANNKKARIMKIFTQLWDEPIKRKRREKWKIVLNYFLCLLKIKTLSLIFFGWKM